MGNDAMVGGPAAVRESGMAVSSQSKGLIADPTDLRDKYYEPTLRPLKAKLPPQRLRKRGGGGLRITIRDQGNEGSCVAQALAGLIDILRLNSQNRRARHDRVSARMLFELAKEQQLAATGRTDIYSLRPGIKTFYHNGVCSEVLWPDEALGDKEFLNERRAKDARSTSLGAYYRLRPVLNDYHAALNDVGAILVAARTHSGWSLKDVVAEKGHINRGNLEGENHAFVVVGYDDTGFFVLNSWGPRWGRYGNLPGIAHWRYEDWAESILDAWVLRLGVPTPQVFHLTIGEQGMLPSGEALRAASTRRSDIIGHYVHLDDGRHVRVGNYPSSRQSVEETVTFLARRFKESRTSRRRKSATQEKPYRHILLRIAGGTEDTDGAAAYAGATKQFWKEHAIYPYSVIWCSDFIARATDVLLDLLKRTSDRVSPPGEAFDWAAESDVRGIGRAFWRDVKRAARVASAGEPQVAGTIGKDGSRGETEAGDLRHLVDEFVSLCKDTGHYRLHLLAEGAGAVLLLRLFEHMADADQAKLAQVVSTVSLVAPACRIDDYQKHGAPFVARLSGPCGVSAGSGRVKLYLASPQLEKGMRIGPYGKSILRLIANAFEEPDEKGGAPPLLGIEHDVGADALAGFDVSKVELPTDVPPPYGILTVIHSAAIRSDIRERIEKSEQRPAGSKRSRRARNKGGRHGV